MGWLFHNDMLTHQTPAEYIAQHFSHENDTCKATVIATATVRGTIYAAIRNEIKNTNKTYVFCGVFLFKNNKKDGFGYKDMDEGMGPCEVDCPDRIMRLLSPVDDMPSPGYAAEWRTRVAAAKQQRANARRNAKTFAPGDTIRLPEPVQFGKSGVSADRFTFHEYRKRTPIFSPVSHPYFLCRLRQSTLAAATLEA
ncbi:hypothetical protein [Methylocystis sp.]|uniref:DUF6927 domain-containing protein n=1 Tax=Methylocystis sp. TaxID=1911079 RepID=UPI0025DF41EF|nr:hypothetical protein [Methylocystis sp.]